MVLEVYKVDVFTKEPLKGNPSAVVLKVLDDETMLKLASELNLSETAFVEKSGDKFHLRFFTPSAEVPLCGHATIGAFYVLKLKGLGNGEYKAVTKAGEVRVRVEDKVWLKVVEPKVIGRLEGLKIADILDSAVVDVGLKVGLAEVASFDELMSIKPDFDSLARYCKEIGIAGVHVFTLDSKFDASARFFAPAVGILEDPVTGTANSALAFYLNVSGKLVKDEYAFEQGHALKREGLVYVRISDGVWVGGDAVCVLRGVLEI
jgi:PhzF family phenazine biosynthesis protein